MDRVKRFLGSRPFLTVGLAFLCEILLSLAGIFCKPYFRNGEYLYYGSIVLWGLLAGGSLICYFVFKKKLQSQSVHDQMNMGEDIMKRIHGDPKRAGRRLNLIAFLCGSFWFLLFLLGLLASFFSGVAGLNGASLPNVFLLAGHISRFLRKKDAIDPKEALNPLEFPLLYELAREAAGPQCKDPIYIYMGPSDGEGAAGASVLQEGGAVHIALGPVLLGILSRQELLQILRHEFAHVGLNHSLEHGRFNRLIGFLSPGDSFLDLATDLALRFPAVYLAWKSDHYFFLNSRNMEAQADAEAFRDKDPSAIAAALAKSRYFQFYRYEETATCCIYAEELPPAHVTTDLFRSFCEALHGRVDFWDRLAKKSIPSRIDSHPTFFQRWEALGKPEYSIVLPTLDDSYGKECLAVMALADKEIAEQDPETYRERREAHYIAHLRTVEEFEAKNTDLPADELRPVIFAYISLGKAKEAEKLCDGLIKDGTPFSSAFANYWKGRLLLYRYDPAGISYLYAALEANSNYIEEGLEAIAGFALLMGLEEELEKYRERRTELLQRSADHSEGGITSKADLSEETLPEGWQEQILQKILSAAKDRVQKVYLVHEAVSEHYGRSSFVLRYKNNISEDDMEEIYGEIFRYLDDFPHDWEFALYDYEMSMEKPLAQVPGSCIYSKS